MSPLAIGLFVALAVPLNLILLFHLRKQTPAPKLDIAIRLLAVNYFARHLALLAITYSVWSKAGDRIAVSAWANSLMTAATFAISAFVYAIREPAKVYADKPREILLPLFCAVLPILIFESGRWMKDSSVEGLSAAIWLMIFGNAIAVWGLVNLRRSFSVFTEVRTLVTTGPYRFIRHPLYLGQSLTTIGLCFLSPSPIKISLTIVFLVAQRLRAGVEERKIADALPEYREYQKRTGVYFPKFSRGES